MTTEPDLMDNGFEDCACGDPCGAEPLGCAGCMSSGSSAKEIFEDSEDCMDDRNGYYDPNEDEED
jgi:hypothetical protein